MQHFGGLVGNDSRLRSGRHGAKISCRAEKLREGLNKIISRPQNNRLAALKNLKFREIFNSTTKA
jgi:hypothetical protein